MQKIRTIGILEAGHTPDIWLEKHGIYADMFKTLLSRFARNLEFTVYPIQHDNFPSSPKDCDGWIVTGSSHGVYEELPWMLKLENFLREAFHIRTPLIGICFGHQILAKALGGTVEKSAKGWHGGFLKYETTQLASWMSPPLKTITLPATHQDQIVNLPPMATVLAASASCPYAVIDYGPSAFSMQAHPEFTGEFLSDLLSTSNRPAETLNCAQNSILNGQTDCDIVAQWIVNFLNQDHTNS